MRQTSLRRPERHILALIPAGPVGVSVVSTGNHDLVDAFVGAAIAPAAYPWLGRRHEPQEHPVLLTDHVAPPSPETA
jgi:hypothetical protein